MYVIGVSYVTKSLVKIGKKPLFKPLFTNIGRRVYPGQVQVLYGKPQMGLLVGGIPMQDAVGSGEFPSHISDPYHPFKDQQHNTPARQRALAKVQRILQSKVHAEYFDTFCVNDAVTPILNCAQYLIEVKYRHEKTASLIIEATFRIINYDKNIEQILWTGYNRGVYKSKDARDAMKSALEAAGIDYSPDQALTLLSSLAKAKADAIKTQQGVPKKAGRPTTITKEQLLIRAATPGPAARTSRLAARNKLRKMGVKEEDIPQIAER